MKQQKQVQILVRYAHKYEGVLTGLISYRVRSSNGKNQYCTTLLHGKAIGCSCPATVKCYHATQLEVIEYARRQDAAQSAFKAVEAIVAATEQLVQPTITQDEQTTFTPVTNEQIESLIQDHELTLLALIKHLPTATQVVASNFASAQATTDLGARGSFHSNKGFSMFKR